MPTFLTQEDALARILVQGESLQADLAAAIVGIPELSLSTSQVGQLSFNVHDPELRMLDGLLTMRAEVTFGDERFVVADLETTGTTVAAIAVKARSRGAQALKKEKGEKVFADVSPTDVARQSAAGLGMAFLGEPTKVRGRISRPGKDAQGREAQSQWDLLRDLAAQEGFVLFETVNTLVFAKPTWLVANAPAANRWTVEWPSGGTLAPLTVPACNKSDATDDEDVVASVSVSVPWAYGVEVKPGHVLTLRGVAGFNGDYLIDNVTIPIDGRSPVSITASTPEDPDPQQSASDSLLDGAGIDAALGIGEGDFFLSPWVEQPDPSVDTGGFNWPVEGTVTSEYSFNRNGRPHEGIDIGGNNGLVIRAARGGTVVFSGAKSGYGNVVVIKHADGFTTRYAHMSKRLVNSYENKELYSSDQQAAVTVTQPREVMRGEPIGIVGSTGNSTGPHLHFEIRTAAGISVNPRHYIPGNPQPAPGTRLAPGSYV